MQAGGDLMFGVVEGRGVDMPTSKNSAVQTITYRMVWRKTKNRSELGVNNRFLKFVRPTNLYSWLNSVLLVKERYSVYRIGVMLMNRIVTMMGSRYRKMVRRFTCNIESLSSSPPNPPWEQPSFLGSLS